jgi:hypothetical protein
MRPKRVIAIFITVFVWVGCALADDSVYIEIKSAKLRQQPKHWAPSLQDLAFGAKLEEVAREGGWVKVRTSAAIEGYVHQSALTNRRIVLSAAGQSTAPESEADPSSIVLAGKGFNQEIQARYQSQRSELNFEAVNKMELRVVDGPELSAFLLDGKLEGVR